MTSLREGRCPKCQSQEIMPNVEAVEGNSLGIRVYEKAGVVLRGMRNFPLKAWVCTNCGYTELYVNTPQELGKAYKRQISVVG